MRNRNVFLYAFFVALILGMTDCKKSTESETGVVLTVQLAAGINGQPSAGSHNYDENEVVSYTYSASAGYENLQIKLDGVSIAASGTITMNTDHTLNGSVQRRMLLQGDWLLTIAWNWVYSDGQCHPENANNVHAICAQDGDDVTVTVTGVSAEDIVLWGTIDVQGNFNLKAEVVSGGVIAKYSFNGSVDINASPLTLSGTSRMEGYLQTDPNTLNCTCDGTITGRKTN